MTDGFQLAGNTIVDVRDGGKTPLRDVAPKIKAALVAQKSERAAQARADEAKAILLGAPDFAAAAKLLGLEAGELAITRPFSFRKTRVFIAFLW